MKDRYSAQGPGGALTRGRVDPGLKTVACLALFALTLPATSQPWCIPGAQWWHTYNDGSGTVGYAHSAYDGDTLINGVNWCRITAQVDAWNIPFQSSYQEELPPLHGRAVGDVVFLLNEGVQDTLYRFGALPGTFWNAPEWIPEVRYSVTDTRTLVVDLVPLRWAAVEVTIGSGEPQVTMTDTLIERFGFLHQYLDPIRSLSLNPFIPGLRCYTDQDLAYTTGIVPSCDFIVSLPDALNASPFVVVSPNPGEDHVTISLPPASQQGFLKVLDCAGREVMTLNALPSTVVLDV